MKYKLVALDMDDTLLHEDLSISEKNIKAIRSMEQMGVKIILCSGRPYDSMTPYLPVLDIHNPDDYMVSFNGAYINRISGEEEFSGVIEGDILSALIDIGRAHNISVQLYNPTLTVERYIDKTKNYEQLTGMKAEVVDDLKTIDYSVKVLFNHVAGDALENLRIDLVEKYGDTLNIFYSKPFYIEVLNRKSSKGLAVKYLAEKLSIKQEEVLVMGDGFNDLSMIQYAGMGVAVNNASEGVKAEADYVTRATHNEDAVWEIYEKFFKNK